MIYTEMTKKAMQIAYNAHKNQVDKSGAPYIFHPIHLAEQMDDEDTICVALLHDYVGDYSYFGMLSVVEDSDMIFEDLENMGFPKDVIEALRLLTHDKSVPYLNYIYNIRDSNNPIAVKVKLADLYHDSNASRLGKIDGSVLARVQKYKAAISILEES